MTPIDIAARPPTGSGAKSAATAASAETDPRARPAGERKGEAGSEGAFAKAMRRSGGESDEARNAGEPAENGALAPGPGPGGASAKAKADALGGDAPARLAGAALLPAHKGAYGAEPAKGEGAQAAAPAPAAAKGEGEAIFSGSAPGGVKSAAHGAAGMPVATTTPATPATPAVAKRAAGPAETGEGRAPVAASAQMPAAPSAPGGDVKSPGPIDAKAAAPAVDDVPGAAPVKPAPAADAKAETEARARFARRDAAPGPAPAFAAATTAAPPPPPARERVTLASPRNAEAVSPAPAPVAAASAAAAPALAIAAAGPVPPLQMEADFKAAGAGVIAEAEFAHGAEGDHSRRMLRGPAGAPVAGPDGRAAAAASSASAQIAAAVSRASDGAIEIRLDPPELGRVSLTLSSAGDGPLSIALAVERPETADLLRRHADLLQRELAAAGWEGATLDFSGDARREGAEGFASAASEEGAPEISGRAEALSLSAARGSASPGLAADGGLDIRL